MTFDLERIPFQVEVGRVIEVLARQIYQSPLALLRENAQNAFDAVLLRQHGGGAFDARIDIEIDAGVIKITDNGIGMTSSDLRDHFWRAGSSSKNTPSARDAGVVGTFGIGAMANFGIADRIVVETESAITGERTLSEAEKAKLSTTEDCITLQRVESKGQPGTTIIAHISAESPVNVDEAMRYVREFVAFVALPVYVNGAVASLQSPLDAVAPIVDVPSVLGDVTLGGDISADIDVRAGRSGEVWVRCAGLRLGGLNSRARSFSDKGHRRSARSGAASAWPPSA